MDSRRRRDAAAIQTALEDTLRRIHRHQRRASDDVCELLEVMATRLCDPELRVEEVQRICPPGSATHLQFLVDLGLKPDAYFKQRLFDMARYLVCKSAVRVGVIAERLGFPEPDLFSKWFRRQSGMAPEKLRATRPLGEIEGGDPGSEPAAAPRPTPLTQKRWRPAWIWHRCLLGCGEPEEAAGLARDLREAYPGATILNPRSLDEEDEDESHL